MFNLKKICIALYCAAFLCSLSTGQESVFSIRIRVSINSGSLQNALQEISNQTGFNFAYRNSLLLNKSVDAKIYNAPLSEILEDILKPKRLCYTIQNKQVIIHTNCLPPRYILSGNILEDSIMEPVPFVFVSIAGRSTGTIADENGHFELETERTDAATEILVFSSMGFYRDSLLITAGKAENLTAMLRRKTYSVPEVAIRADDYVLDKLGNTKDRPSGSLYLDTHGQQTALFLSNKKGDTGILTSVEYYLSENGNTDAPFRVRIYKADSNGYPGIDLIEDALVVKPGVTSGWYSVNVEPLHLEIPKEGIFIAIEGVFPDDYNRYYGESGFLDLANQDKPVESPTLSYGQRVGYNRKCRKQTWHYSLSKVWFQLNKQSFGVMISAVVRYREVNKKEKSENDE